MDIRFVRRRCLSCADSASHIMLCFLQRRLMKQRRGVVSWLTGSNRTVEVHALRQTGRARVPIKKRRSQAGRYCASLVLCTFERLRVSSVLWGRSSFSSLAQTTCLSSFKGIQCFQAKHTTQNGGLFNQFLTWCISAHRMHTKHDWKILHVHWAFSS